MSENLSPDVLRTLDLLSRGKEVDIAPPERTGKSVLEERIEKPLERAVREGQAARDVREQDPVVRKAIRGKPATEKEIADRQMYSAMEEDYGSFISDPDPTGMIDTGFAADTFRLPEVQESYRKLEAASYIVDGEDDPVGFDDPDNPFDLEAGQALNANVTLEEFYNQDQFPDDDDEDDDDWWSRNLGQPGQRLREIGFGLRKPPTPLGGVPLKKIVKTGDTFAEHGGLAGAAAELAMFLTLASKETIKAGAGAVTLGFSPYDDSYEDLKNGLVRFFNKDSKDVGTSFAKFHYLVGSRNAGEAIDFLTSRLKDAGREVLGIRDNETYEQFWNSIRDPLSVPKEDADSLSLALSVFGLFAPLAGTGSAVHGGRLLQKYTQNTVLAASIARKVGALESLKVIPFRQFFDLDIAKKTFPDIPEYILYNDASVLKQIKKFQDRGIDPQVARRKSVNKRRDFVAAAGAGAMYALFQRFQDNEDLSAGVSIAGALLANTTGAYIRRGASRARFSIGKLTAAMGLTSREQRDAAIDAFKNSESKNMNQYRETFLRMAGMNGDDIKSATRESLEMGNAVKKEIRELEAAGNKQEATNLLNKSISEGLLDSKGRPHRFHLINTYLDSKFTKNTLEFGHMFKRNLMKSDDSEQFVRMAESMHSLLDDLSSVAPKAMEKFPLLIEQMTGFAALQAMRNALVNQAEFSSISGRVISGSYLTEAERYHKILSQQATGIQEVIKELRGSDAKESEFLMDFLGIITDSIGRKDLDWNSSRILQLKKLAANPRNRRLEALEEYQDELRNLAQVADAGDPAAVLKHSRAQRKILIDTFDERRTEAQKLFDNIAANPKYTNLQISLDNFLLNLPKERLAEEVPRNLENFLTNFGQLDRATSNRIRQDVAYRSLQRDFQIPKQVDEDYYNGEFVNKIQQFVELSLDKKSQEKQEIFQRIMNNADTVALSGDKNIKEGINLALRSLASEIPTPANVSIETFMDVRKAMSLKLRNEWRAGNFDAWRDTRQRISELDDAFDGTPVTKEFLTDYAAARKYYKEEFEAYLDDKGPFSKFDNVNEAGRQDVSGHRLFDLFHKPGMTSEDYETNARQFEKVFFNPATGKFKTYEGVDSDGNVIEVYDPIQELVYSLSNRMVDNFEGVNPSSVDDLIGDAFIYYTPILEKAGYGKFVETMKGYIENNSVKDAATDADKKTVTDAILRYVNQADTNKINAFNNAAIMKLGGGEGLQDLGIKVGNALQKVEDYQAALLLRGGSSVNVNTQKYFYDTLKKSDEYVTFSPRQKKMIDDIVFSPEFKNALDEISAKASPPGESALKIVLMDGQAKVNKGVMDEKEFTRLQEAARVMIWDNFNKKSLPFINQTKVDTTLDAKTQEAIERIAEQENTSTRRIKLAIKFGDAEIRDKLRQQDLSDVLIQKTIGKMRVSKAYRLNLQNEFDPVAAQAWFRDNRDILALTYMDKNGNLSKMGKMHLEALDSLIQFGSGLKTFSIKQAIKNIPTPYTVMMATGRIYNSFGKRVVSPTYIGMENIVINYRLMQAGIIKDILSNPKTTKFFADIYSRGFFEPKGAKDFIRFFAVNVAQYGGKLLSKQQDALAEFLAEEARVTKRLIEEEKSTQSQKEDVDLYSTFYKAPSPFLPGGQSYDPKTGRFYDRTEELPD